MWKWVKAEAVYYVRALKECQRWKGYKAMMRLSRMVRIAAVILFGGVGVITVIVFLQPYLPKLSWLVWLIIGLSATIFGLVSVIHFLGRSYDRAISEAEAKRESDAKIQSEFSERWATLSYAIAAGRTLYDQLDSGQLISAQRLARWRSDTVSALGICFGSDVATQFYKECQYDPPSTDAEQRAWLMEYVDRLGLLGTSLQAASSSRKLQM